MKEQDPKIITLKNLEVAFANLDEDGQFGKSITVFVDDPVVEDRIKTWVKTNNIGKENPGIAKFYEHENRKQFAFKFSRYTNVVDSNNNDALDGLNRHAVIAITAKAYEYNSAEYGKGVSQTLLSVVVMKPVADEAKVATSELLSELDEENNDQSQSDVAPTDIPEEEINLDDIPF